MKRVALLLLIVIPFIADAQKRKNRVEMSRYPNSRQYMEKKTFRDNKVEMWEYWYEAWQTHRVV